eukprot:COSAG01_NODE_6059_length_3875_cov_286.205244_3_plen_88_part_00
MVGGAVARVRLRVCVGARVLRTGGCRRHPHAAALRAGGGAAVLRCCRPLMRAGRGCVRAWVRVRPGTASRVAQGVVCFRAVHGSRVG